MRYVRSIPVPCSAIKKSARGRCRKEKKSHLSPRGISTRSPVYSSPSPHVRYTRMRSTRTRTRARARTHTQTHMHIRRTSTHTCDLPMHTHLYNNVCVTPRGRWLKHPHTRPCKSVPAVPRDVPPRAPATREISRERSRVLHACNVYSRARASEPDVVTWTKECESLSLSLFLHSPFRVSRRLFFALSLSLSL